jgi:hypothetical protein
VYKFIRKPRNIYIYIYIYIYINDLDYIVFEFPKLIISPLSFVLWWQLPNTVKLLFIYGDSLGSVGGNQAPPIRRHYTYKPLHPFRVIITFIVRELKFATISYVHAAPDINVFSVWRLLCQRYENCVMSSLLPLVYVYSNICLLTCLPFPVCDRISLCQG